LLILFSESGLFVSSHAVAPFLSHSAVVLRAPPVWTRTVVSTFAKKKRQPIPEQDRDRRRLSSRPRTRGQACKIRLVQVEARASIIARVRDMANHHERTHQEPRSLKGGVTTSPDTPMTTQIRNRQRTSSQRLRKKSVSMLVGHTSMGRTPRQL
jgi:hypothetical protein